jgi:hypothetical protein
MAPESHCRPLRAVPRPHRTWHHIPQGECRGQTEMKCRHCRCRMVRQPFCRNNSQKDRVQANPPQNNHLLSKTVAPLLEARAMSLAHSQSTEQSVRHWHGWYTQSCTLRITHPPQTYAGCLVRGIGMSHHGGLLVQAKSPLPMGGWSRGAEEVPTT